MHQVACSNKRGKILSRDILPHYSGLFIVRCQEKQRETLLTRIKAFNFNAAFHIVATEQTHKAESINFAREDNREKLYFRLHSISSIEIRNLQKLINGKKIGLSFALHICINFTFNE